MAVRTGVQSPGSQVAVWVSHQPGSRKQARSVIGVPGRTHRSAPASTVGATFRTTTVRVSVPTPPSSSRTWTVSVYSPSSQYAWRARAVPTARGGSFVSLTVPTTGRESSPKKNVASCVSSHSSSVNDASNSTSSPSSTVMTPPASTTGGTLRARTAAKCRVTTPPGWLTVVVSIATYSPSSPYVWTGLISAADDPSPNSQA